MGEINFSEITLSLASRLAMKYLNNDITFIDNYHNMFSCLSQDIKLPFLIISPPPSPQPTTPSLWANFRGYPKINNFVIIGIIML